MIKAIIFDFAGVIGTEGYSLWAKEKKAQGIEATSTYFHDISDDMDRGSISTQTFSQEVAKVVGIASSDVWKEISQKIKINNELLDLIINLKKKYKIGLLTNYSDVWMKELISKYELDKYFDSMVISSLHKVIKPDKKINQILKDHKLPSKLPEDLKALIIKEIRLTKHLELNRKDFTVKRGQQITESKIKKLAKYYINTKVLPADWKYDRAKAKLLIE